jgi:serine O-acetyltransferase
MLRAVWMDAIEMTRASGVPVTLRTLGRSVFLTDSFPVMVMTRVREVSRRWHVPLVNRALRYTQMALFGIEIGKDVELAPGVFFVHTLGTVVGGDSKIGARVRILGGNTIGTAKDNGCPVIEEDVEIGVGARILGPIRIGARAQIGANAVVIRDVPPDTFAAGVPATLRPLRPPRGPTST